MNSMGRTTDLFSRALRCLDSNPHAHVPVQIAVVPASHRDELVLDFVVNGKSIETYHVDNDEARKLVEAICRERGWSLP
jgi:hypothetical protein